MSIVAYVAVMAGVTYLIRMLPLTLFRKEIKSKFFRRFLYYIPYAVLSAMTIPAIFYCVGDEFTVQAEGWQDYTVKYDAIESIAYEENMFRDTNTIRTNGFGNLKYSMGHFRDEIHADYIRYTHNDCDTYVVMEVEGSTVILNGADDAQTREIYNNIRERMEK